MEIRNILVPVDFTPASRQAVDFAVPFARIFRAQLTLLHVVAENDKAGTPDANAKLHQLAKVLPPDGTEELDIQTRIRNGNIEDEICSAIDDEFAGIVVMGTHHHGLMRRLLTGSLSEGILRKVPVPLLTVSSEVYPRSLTRILFATDLSEPSQEGFRFALELARTLGAHLIVHHSIEPIPVSYGGSMPVIDDPTDRKHLIDHARRKLSEFESEGARRQVVVVSEITEGAASGKILEAAEKMEAGLIVLAIHYKGALERALLGSTAERVVREARVPVLSFPVNEVTNRIEAEVHPRIPIPDPSALP